MNRKESDGEKRTSASCKVNIFVRFFGLNEVIQILTIMTKYQTDMSTIEKHRQHPNKRIDLIISNKVYFVLDKLANLSA